MNKCINNRYIKKEEYLMACDYNTNISIINEIYNLELDFKDGFAKMLDIEYSSQYFNWGVISLFKSDPYLLHYLKTKDNTTMILNDTLSGFDTIMELMYEINDNNLINLFVELLETMNMLWKRADDAADVSGSD